MDSKPVKEIKKIMNSLPKDSEIFVGNEGVKVCNDHEIIWDLDSIEIRIGDIDEGIEFEGKCSVCGQSFLKTYIEPVYTLLKGSERVMQNEWDYKIASEKYIHTKEQKIE